MPTSNRRLETAAAVTRDGRLGHSLAHVLLAWLLIGSPALPAARPQLSGLWDGTIKFDEVVIAFPMQLSANGTAVQGSFFNGDERITSTSGSFHGHSLVLNFDHYGMRLDATLQDGVLRGTYGNRPFGLHEFELRPHRAQTRSRAKAPDISGLWTLPFESPKGEHAFRLIVRQHGSQISAAILRVDGDTGLLTGEYRDGEFYLNHFDGGRALTLSIAPRADGKLDLLLRGFHAPELKFTAVRPAAAQAQGLPAPSDFTAHTRMKDPNEPLRFSFPDLRGHLVSNTDPQFRDKVVVVNITGSWCPNCHDEAPFLAQLYRRYRGLGLEIVAVDFEDAEQLAHPTRIPAFIKRYGIEYTYLLAGETSELNTKMPQAENLNAWPTTFFLGRDGKVRSIHTGFAGRASGEFHEQMQRDFTRTVEQLLAQ
jgi:thiol-disulfide isomerase/thioredoxin